MNSEKNSKDKKPKKLKKSNLFYDFVKITGAIPAWLMFRPKIYYPYGKPKMKGAVLVSSNHVSLCDPVIVLCTFPTRRLNSLATKELFKPGLLDALFRGFHCIKVDRDRFSPQTLKEVIECLKNKEVVVVFPEGRINDDSSAEMLGFKRGAVYMANRGGAPVLPMYIEKREKWYHRQRIVVGEMLDLSPMLGVRPDNDTMDKVCMYLRDKELELKHYCEAVTRKKKSGEENNEVEA